MKQQQVLSKANRMFLAKRSEQSQVMYHWALWLMQRGITIPAKRTATFRKGEAELLVYEYGGNFCAVVKKGKIPNRFQQFREWSQPFDVVMQKLAASKWTLVKVTDREVQNAH